MSLDNRVCFGHDALPMAFWKKRAGTQLGWAAQWSRGEAGGVTFVKFPRDAVRGASLTAADAAILTEYGLPDSAAPYLSFDTEPGLLASARSIGLVPSGTERLLEIGANGSGDPICLDTDSGAVCYLNHDDDFARVAINSSVSALVQFLELFRELVRRRAALGERGPDGKPDDSAQQAFDDTVAAMRALDPAALEAGAMWHQELEGL